MVIKRIYFIVFLNFYAELKPQQCNKEQFTCNNGQCLDRNWRCDQDRDCDDGSDELDCDPRVCTQDEFKCKNGRCIPKGWVCDMITDCSDGSDETCNERQCSGSEFKCHHGGCVPLSWYCDGQIDCPSDGSDEMDCDNVPYFNQITCPLGQFKCKNNRCISLMYRCDNQIDCPDGSDEINCDEHLRCKNNEFKCSDGQCINSEWRCDVERDCIDGSDEAPEICSSNLMCGPDQFRCNSGRCISSDFRCDSFADCADGSDERDCKNAKCASGGFLCKDGTCISSKLVCDGAPQCPDGSDELLNTTCLHNAKPCKEDGHPCQHLCMPTNNGHQCACRPGYQLASDLRSCLDIDECNVASKLHCSQSCENTVPGYICTCSSGYELLPDGHHCRALDKQPMRLLYANRVDIRWLIPPDQMNYYNIYVEEFKKLQQRSTTASTTPSLPSSSVNKSSQHLNQKKFSNNKINSELPPPFTSFTDEQQAEISEMWFSPLLYYNFSTSAQLSEINLQQQQFSASTSSNTNQFTSGQILLNNLQNAVSIDFHWSTGRLYWADITQDAIYTMHINGSSIDGSQTIRPIVQAGLVSPSGLCVDWINNLVIWSDSGTSRIELCDLDGDNRHVLLHRDVRRPRDIVVYPQMGLIAFTDWGSNQGSQTGAKIERVYLDGTGRQCIICNSNSGNSKLYWPNGLTIDYSSERIYWIDAKRHIIESANLDGTNRRTVIQSSKYLPHPFSLTIFEDQVIFTDWHTKSIHSVSKLNSFMNRPGEFEKDTDPLPPTTLIQKLHFPMDIVAVHPVRQPPVQFRQCASNNCSHICLPNNVSYTCACPTGFQMSSDNYNCNEQPHNFLLFSRKNDIRWLCVDCETELMPPSSNNNLNKNTNLNSSTSPSQHETSDGNDRIMDAVLPLEIQTAVSLDYDFQSRTIYWSDIVSDTINKAAWNGTNQHVLISQPLITPAAVAIDWIGRNLYFADSSRNLIECSTLTGQHRTVLIYQRLQRPRDIVLDSSLGLLFWTHSAGHRFNLQQPNLEQQKPTSGILERSSLDGTRRMQLIAGDRTLPRALTLDYQEHRLYFCDANQKQIESINYEGGDRKLVLRSVQPYALTLHAGLLYWTDYQAKRLQRVKLDGLEPDADLNPTIQSEESPFLNRSVSGVETLLSGLENLMDIKMFHNDKPLRNLIPAYASNNCSSLRCEQLCLLNEKHGGQCKCSTGITLDHNGRTCARDMRRYLLIAKRTMISRVSLDVPYFAEVTMKLNTPYNSLRSIQANLSNVITVDADISQRTIYWADTNLKRIFAYQYASSINTGAQQIKTSLKNINNQLPNQLNQTVMPDSKMINKVKSVYGRKKDHLGRNMTLIWKNVMDKTLGKVVGWVSGNSSPTTTNSKVLNQKKLKQPSKSKNKISRQKAKMLNSQKIPKSAFGLGNVRTVHRVGIQDVRLAVDVLGRKLYWTDSVRKRIEVSQLNGKQRKILLYRDLDNPKALTLHHRCGLMFWVDLGNTVQKHSTNGSTKASKQQQQQTPLNCANNNVINQTVVTSKLYPQPLLQQQQQPKPCGVRIEKADMDGSKRTVLVNTQLGNPVGLTTIHLSSSSSYQYSSYASLLNKQTEDVCSLKNLKIIWIDSKLRTLEMIDLDGTNRKVLVKKLHSPYGIAALNGAIYWSDIETKSIYSVNVEQAKTRDEKISESLIVSEPRSILSNLNNIVDIRLANRDELMTQVANGSLMETQAQQFCKVCSDLCLRHSTGYSCACPTGVVLLADQHTCQDDMSTFLLFANKHSILRISMNTDDYNEVYLDLVHLENVVSVDYDYKNKRIYYSDVNLDQIGSTNFDGTGLKIHISTNLHTVDGIAVDWVSGNLYFTDTGRDVIEVCRLNGSSRKVIINTDLDEPRAIAVHPVKALLFFSDWGKQPKIERSYLDGSNRIVLTNTDIGWPNGLAIDYDMNRLYWTDAQLDRIESIDFDGRNRLLVVSQVMHPYGITVFGQTLYWSDWAKSAVESADKVTGGHRQTIAENIEYLMEIKMVTPSRETDGNPCGTQNGGCSHLCLFRPQGYICACPDKPDGSVPCSTVPGEISADPQAGNKRDLDYSILDSEQDLTLPRDGLLDVVDDDEMILVDSSSEMPKQSIELDPTDQHKPTLNKDPPIRNIVLTGINKGHDSGGGGGKFFNETMDCDEEDCTINKFSLEDSFFQLASFITSFAIILFAVLFIFICYIICKRKRNRQTSIVNSSKSNSSLDSKLNQKYSRASTDAIHTLANGHQQILHSTLPRDSKWEKKKVRALNQDLFTHDHKSSMKSLILGAQTPTPPLPPMQSNLYPLPLLSLPSQANMNADLFDDNQPEADAFFLNHNLNHARHHLHMHHQQHLIDHQLEPTVDQSNDLLLSNLNNQNSINYQILNSRTPISSASLLPSSFPTSTTNDSYLFNQTENTNCSHCYGYGYELSYDCHNLGEITTANNNCNLMLLPSNATSYHLHHPMYTNLHNEYHSCDTQTQFNNNWPNADFNQHPEPNTSTGYHSRPMSKHQDIQDQLKGTLLEDDLAEESMAENATCNENDYKSSNQMNQTTQIAQMNQVKSDEKQTQNKDENLVKSTNVKLNQLNETSEERSSTNSNNSKSARLQQPRLQRTQSFTVEEVDLSEN